MPADFTKGVGADGIVVFNHLKLPDGTSVMDSIPYKKVVVAHNADLNTFIDDGYYISNGGGSGGPQNGPPGSVFTSWTCKVNNLQDGMIIQEFVVVSGSTYQRLRNAALQWLNWGHAYGGGNGVNVIQNSLFVGLTALDTGTATTSEIATLVNTILSKLQSGNV